MSDYIMNRKSLKRHCKAVCEKFKDVPTSGAYGEHRLVLDLLEQTEWIPVSKRLPENDKDVLVCFPQGDMAVAYYHIDDTCYPTQFADLNETGWFNEEGDAFYFDPIAWMPLPEKYEPKESKEKWINIAEDLMPIIDGDESEE